MAATQKPFSLDDRNESLRTQWNRITAELYQRPAFRDHPELVAEAENIRDVYIQLFAWRQPLLRQIDNLHKRGLSVEEQRSIKDTLAAQINNLDYHLISHNHHSFLRLQSGPLSLLEGDAKKTLCSIIGRTIDTFENACRRDCLKRPEVPHVPLETVPESVRKLIIVPQTIDPF